VRVIVAATVSLICRRFAHQEHVDLVDLHDKHVPLGLSAVHAPSTRPIPPFVLVIHLPGEFECSEVVNTSSPYGGA